MDRELQVSDADNFVGYFQKHLAFKISTGEVSFTDRSAEDVQEQMGTMVRNIFYAYTGLNGRIPRSGDLLSDRSGAQAHLPLPLSGTSSFMAPALEPHPHMPYASSPSQQPQPPQTQRTYPPGHSVDVATAVSPGGGITYAVQGISITEPSHSSPGAPYPVIMPRQESLLAAQQQQAGTANSQQHRQLRQLAPAPRAPQQETHPQPAQVVGRSHFGQPAHEAHVLQNQGQQAQNWQHDSHMHPLDYSQQDATNYYKVPWQVDNMAHHANVSMSAARTRQYDPVATMGAQTTGTGYYTSQEGYAVPSHNDYRPH
ncbi:MAG: hypothetical protein STHCBS139747_002358 [Sporothrix thermara]